MSKITDIRRYDLDWLRVIAFGLLILYHIGMFYVSWGWHVKSIHAGPFAEPAMILLNPWRLSLLFLISGVAFRFAVDKKQSPAGFARKRFLRLFIPLVFGMIIIVAPQSYFELLAKGEISEGYLDFYSRYLSADNSFSVVVPTWNHLWYLVYLIIYSMLIIPVMPLVRRLAACMDSNGFENIMAGGRIFLLPALLFVLYRFTTDMWYPNESHAFWGDWGAHARYFSYFLIGILVAKNSVFWRVLACTWRRGAAFVLFLALVLSPLWANWQWVEGQPLLRDIARAMRVIYAWAMIATLMGAAQHYLNRPSVRLSYLSQAIFPYYILHQTLIVLFGVFLTGFALSAPIEFALLLAMTIAGCVLIYEFIIRRVPILRPLFGVPMQQKTNS